MYYFIKLITALLILTITACGGGGESGSSGPSYTPIQTLAFYKAFTGSTEQVLDPFDLPAGLYKITVITQGYFQLFQEGNRSSIMNLSRGEADGAEAVFKSHGGIYTFRTDNISRDWELKFEHIDFSNPAPISDISNVTASTPKVLGPYRMENKTYVVTMYTDGYFQLFPIDPEYGNKGRSIFNKSSGNWGASTTFAPQYDIMLFRTANISATWNIRFDAM